MKIAVISDIHGNLPALEAVLDDIARRQVDKTICLGDIIGKGPSSKEALDICRANCDLIVQGNWEAVLYNAYRVLREDTEARVGDNFVWYVNDTGAERMEYLGNLPHSAELYLSGKLVRLFHAHPINFNRYFADSPITQRLELFGSPAASAENRQSDVAVYADIHNAYMQTLESKILINVGSVGNPLDMPQASYAILEGDETRDSLSSFNVQLIKVPYDIARAVALAEACCVPYLQEYIIELTTSKYFDRGKK